jgi:hypothetical protein
MQIKIKLIEKSEAVQPVKAAIVKAVPAAAMLVTDKQISDAIGHLFDAGYMIVKKEMPDGR